MTWCLINWFYNSSTQKFLAALDSLVKTMMLADDFNSKHLEDFDVHREMKCLDDSPPHDPSATSPTFSDGWHTTSISIRLPCKNIKQAESAAPEFAVNGLHYRKITDVVKAAFSEPVPETFHLAPYKVFWQPDKMCSPECVFTEAGDFLLQEHGKTKNSPLVAGCNFETVVATIMLWSDSTHLASFGNVALWPIYLFIGNQSKYAHAKPSSFVVHHLAYSDFQN